MDSTTIPSNYKQCPECNLVVESSIVRCPQCGHKYRTQFAPPAPPRPVQSTVAIGCIQCGAGEVQKVSAIVHAEDAAVSSVMRRSGSRPLAVLLAPPPRPEYQRPGDLYTAGFLAAIFVIAAIAWAVMGLALWLGLIALVVGIIAGVVGLATRNAATTAQKRFATSEARWHKVMDTWNMLFYCPHCDCIYNPATRQTAAPSAMNTLL
jgi:hypothetical protein